MHTVTSLIIEGGRYIVEAVPDDILREEVVCVLESGKMRLLEELGLYRYTYYELIARAVYRPRARHYLQAIQDAFGKDEAGAYILMNYVTGLPLDQLPRFVAHDCFSERDEYIFRRFIMRELDSRCGTPCFYYNLKALLPEPQKYLLRQVTRNGACDA